MSPKKPFRYWPIVAVAVIAAAMFFSNQTAPLPQGGAAITSDSEYQDAMTKMKDLSEERIKAFDAGKPLSTADKEELRQAGKLVDRMDAYLPLFSGLYFINGKIHHILGEDDVAEEQFRQCTLNAPADARTNAQHSEFILQTAAEAAYQLSLLLIARGDTKGALEQADAAVKAVPQSSEYHTARASALNEVRRTDEAKKELTLALKLNPNNARAASLLRFLSH